MKKAASMLVIAVFVVFSSVASAEARNMIEFLLLYQQSVSSLTGVDGEYYMVRNFLPVYSPGMAMYDGGELFLDSSLNIHDAFIDYYDFNASEEENVETVSRFVSAMCALEYSSYYYDIHDLLYENGLTENETPLDEAFSILDEYFTLDYDTLIATQSGEDVLMYEGEDYSYYLTYFPNNDGAAADGSGDKLNGYFRVTASINE